MLLASMVLALQSAATPFPIMGWWGPPANEAGYKVYQEAGFNLVLLSALDVDGIAAAKKAGIGVVLRGSEPAEGVAGWMAGDVTDDALAKGGGKLPSFSGPYGPFYEIYPGPDNVPIGRGTFETAVAAGARVLSFDHYTLYRGGREDDDNFYASLQSIAGASRELGVPFWGTVLATSHGGYRKPSESDLYWQVYSLLAYGAKGLSYFTFNGPKSDSDDFKKHYSDWGIPLYDADQDKPGERYPVARAINAEVQRLAPHLLTARFDGAYHWDRSGPVPAYLAGITGGSILTGSLTEADGSALVMVVNKRHKAETLSEALTDTVRIRFTPEVTKVERIDGADGTLKELPLADSVISLTLGGGKGVLLRITHKAVYPEAGIQPLS